MFFIFNFLTANKPILLTFAKQIHPKELLLNKAKITTFHANVWNNTYPFFKVNLTHAFMTKETIFSYDKFAFFCWWRSVCISQLIRIRKSKNDRQYDGQTNKDKRTHNDLQNNTQKTKDRVTRFTLNTGGELRCSQKGKQFLLH